jgi:amidase
LALALSLAALSGCTNAPRHETTVERKAEASAFTLEETSVADLQQRMASGDLTSHAIVQQYLERIVAIDAAGPLLKSVMEVNLDALAAADALDAERKAGKVRGPLHGIPVLLKDNIDTADPMQTSAGSLALVGAPPAQDSTVAAKLREAGAVILGKTNLSEWANIRSSRSTSGWSARGGQTRNPYVLDRNPCGSSSGSAVAVAANLAAISVGTETDGSIICPAAINALVGIKPTVGLVSRAGIVPISHSQDTAGPMARSVADAALLLTALVGADARDRASFDADKHRTDFTRALDVNALKGARLGVARKFAGFNADVDVALDRAIAALRAAGATVIETEVPNADKYGDAEMIVLMYELKADLNAYLATRRGVPVTSLADVIAFNKQNAAKEMPWFSQELFEQAQAKGPLTDKVYKEAAAKARKFAREGIDATLKKDKLDALIWPSNAPAWSTDWLNGDHVTGGNTSPAAVAGYPSITVPMGQVHELPVGLSFTGTAWSEGKLISLTYAYEQATHLRKAPKFLATLPAD